MKRLRFEPEMLPSRQNLIRGFWIRWILIAIIVVIALLDVTKLQSPLWLFVAVISCWSLYNLVLHILIATQKLREKAQRVVFASHLPISALVDIAGILFLVWITGGITSEYFYILVLRIIYSAATVTAGSVAIQTFIASLGYLIIIATLDISTFMVSIPIVVLRMGILWSSFFIVSFINRERNLNLAAVKELDKRLRQLLELSSRINRAKDLTEILDFATQASYSLIKGSSSSTVLTLSDDGKSLLVKATTGLTPGELDNLTLMGIPVGKGIVGMVAQTGKPDIIPDVDKCTQYMQVRDDIKSELAVPIVSEGKVLGVFNLESVEYEAFSQEDIRYMETLSDIVAVALNNAKLYSRLESQVKTLTTLVEVSNTMISSIGEDVLEFIIAKAKDLLKCDHATIFMLDNEGYIRGLVSNSPDRDAFLAVRIKPGSGVTGSVIANGKPRLVDDSTRVPERVLVPGTEDVPESMICVPLKLREKIMGAITVNKSGITNYFTDRDMELLELFANLAAAAIESSEAFRTEKERREALEAALKLQNIIMDNMTNALKTPLANVSSYLEVLRTESELASEDISKYLLNMEAQAKRLDNTLDRILFASRLANHRVEVHPEKVFLRMLILEIHENYLRELESREINFQLESPNKAVSVIQDESLLRKLLQDFLDNAVVYNSDGGLLDVRLEEMDGFVRTTITDTGVGLPPGFKENLLTALTANTEHKGAGLGLYSSMLIAELLNIKVDIESRLGLGTTITLDIYPLKDNPALKPVSETALPS